MITFDDDFEAYEHLTLDFDNNISGYQLTDDGDYGISIENGDNDDDDAHYDKKWRYGDCLFCNRVFTVIMGRCFRCGEKCPNQKMKEKEQAEDSPTCD